MRLIQSPKEGRRRTNDLILLHVSRACGRDLSPKARWRAQNRVWMRVANATFLVLDALGHGEGMGR